MIFLVSSGKFTTGGMETTPRTMTVSPTVGEFNEPAESESDGIFMISMMVFLG
jgi:hypothetical protein